jgi:hypothetical protein
VQVPPHIFVRLGELYIQTGDLDRAKEVCVGVGVCGCVCISMCACVYVYLWLCGGVVNGWHARVGHL